MSEIIVRPSTKADLDGIARLFLPQKREKDTLKWVLTDWQGKMRSFVAVSEGQIVGHVGYVISDYKYNGTTYKGVFTIEWIVDADYAGQAGLMLYSKVLKLGDFTFIIGGTETVNKIYPLLKFKVPLHVSKFLKVTRPLPYLKALDNKLWKKIAKTVFYSRGLLISKPPPKKWRAKPTTFDGDITLASYNKNLDIPDDRQKEETCFFCEPTKKQKMTHPSLLDESIVANTEKADYIDWLLKAPDMDVYPFTIQKEGKPIGMALCYVQNIHGLLTGRVVHISYLGEDSSLWRQVIYKVEQFLVKKGCCIITTIASNSIFVKALKDSGYIVTRELPFWLKDNKKIFSDASWHLTYLEGDLAYRGMFTSF